MQSPQISGPPSPAIRAIFNATRVLVSDLPSSILVNGGLDTRPLVSRLALDLVRNSREDGLDVSSRDKEHQRRSLRAPTLRTRSSDAYASGQLVEHNVPNPAPVFSKVSAHQATTSLGQALSSSSTGSSRPQLSKPPPGPTNKVARMGAATFGRLTAVALMPALIGRSSEGGHGLPSSSPAVYASGSLTGGLDSKATGGATSSPSDPVTTAPRPPGTGTVELESIVPQLARPPTLLLAKLHGSSLSSPDFKPRLPYVQANTGATRFVGAGDKEPLTDRYGFIYVSCLVLFGLF